MFQGRLIRSGTGSIVPLTTSNIFGGADSDPAYVVSLVACRIRRDAGVAAHTLSRYLRRGSERLGLYRYQERAKEATG